MKNYAKFTALLLLATVSVVGLFVPTHKDSSPIVAQGLPNFQVFQLLNPIGYGAIMSNGISTSTLFASSSPTYRGITATSSIILSNASDGCAQFTSGSLNSSGSACASVGSTFFATSSKQALATTTLSGITGSTMIDFSFMSSTTPSSAGVSYDAIRICFNTCTVASGDKYDSYLLSMTVSNTITRTNEANYTTGGLLTPAITTIAGGGDPMFVHCTISNQTTASKYVYCTNDYFDEGTNNQDRLVSTVIIYKQTTAAPITSVTISGQGTGNYTTFATSTIMTAKIL